MNPGEQETPEEQVPSSCGTPPPPPIGPPSPIQWNLLFRLASPLAIVSGVAASLFSPIVIVLVLPITLKRIIARYKPFHTGILQTGQGAAMGAFAALLSFVAYLVIMIPVITANPATLQNIIRKNGAHNPNPQLAQGVITNEGFAVFVASFLILAFAIFLITGTVSGALFTRSKRLP